MFFAPTDAAAEGTLDIAVKFRARGARKWIAGECEGARALLLAPDLDPACAPLVAVPRRYGAINALAVRRSCDPEVPQHPNKVTGTI